jgi:hypothetical protein
VQSDGGIESCVVDPLVQQRQVVVPAKQPGHLADFRSLFAIPAGASGPIASS